MSPRIVWKTEDNILLNLNNLIETQTGKINSLRTLITKLYLMNWFKWKQWLLAFCVATTVNVQGATLDEWGESTPPISNQSAEEESKYVFPDWRNTHVDYENVQRQKSQSLYISENKPTITAPANLYDNSFGFDIVKGDLDATIYLEVQYFASGTDNRPTSFIADNPISSNSLPSGSIPMVIF